MKLTRKQRRAALERGTWIHELLMVDADGESWQARHIELTQKFANLWEEEREELGDLPVECGRIMRAYKRYYRDDEKRWRVIDTEMNEVVTLPFGTQMVIIVDKIVEDKINGGLWAVDYKTRKSFDNAQDMMVDPQLTLYFWGLQTLGYKDMRGAMYDELRTKAPTIPRRLKSGHLSVTKNIDTDVYTYMREINRHGLDPTDYSDILMHLARNQKDRFFRRTPIPKDPPVVNTVMREAMQTAKEIETAEKRGSFPRTYDKSCSWGCDYKDLCLVELYGGDPDPLIKMNFNQKEKD